MIDMAKATLMIEKLAVLQAENPELGYIRTAMIPKKKQWKVQIEGCYDLIFPYMHIDYPTREDVYNYISELFRLHHSINYHKYTPNQTPVMPILMRDPMTIPGNVNLLEAGIFVKRGSTINAIGYGL